MDLWLYGPSSLGGTVESETVGQHDAITRVSQFFRADIINGALAGKVPGSGFEIGQRFLALTTIYIVIPSLMVVVSLLAPARINRRVNIVVSLLYAATVIASMIGESWAYYIIGSVVEVVLLLAISRVAWTWPRGPLPR